MARRTKAKLAAQRRARSLHAFRPDTPPPTTPPTSPPSTRTRGRLRQKRPMSLPADPAPQVDVSMDFVDLTNDTTDDDVPSVFEEAVRFKAARPKYVVPTSPTKGTPRSGTPVPNTTPNAQTPSVPTPLRHTFTPMRSVLSSLNMDDFKDSSPEDGEIAETGTRSVPSLDSKAPVISGKQKEKEKKRESDAEQEAGNESVLLLPDHVQIAVDDDGADEANDSALMVMGHMEGVHVVDDDRQKGMSRYWMEEEDKETQEFLAAADQRNVCRRCKKPGHIERKCPHTICQVCGAMDEHERKDCPMTLVCFHCGGRGHRKADCPDPKAKFSRARGCERCGNWDHRELSCPLVWRVYCYRKSADREKHISKRANATSWAKQAVGGDVNELWCYNCAAEGHLGDDCDQRHHARGKPVFNTAFSERIASGGPYGHLYTQRPTTRRTGTNFFAPLQNTHKRFDDEPLPGESGWGAFRGAGAGQKSRQRERDRLREAERRDMRNGADDYDDWFSRAGNSRGGRDDRDRGRGGRYDERPGGGRDSYGGGGRYGDRGNSGYGGYGGYGNSPRGGGSYPRQRSRSPDRNARDRYPEHARQGYGSGSGSDRDSSSRRGQVNDGRMPPVQGARAANRGPMGPSSGSGGGSGLLAKALRQSASQSQSQSNSNRPSPASSGSDQPGPNQGRSKSAQRRRRRAGGSIDDEATMRASGALGGSVVGWGQQMGLDNRDSANGSSGQRNQPAGSRGNRGQRYTGGY